jgi:hypothetical protein
MAFWTSTALSPNLANRFLVEIPINTGATTYSQILAKSVSPMPSFTTELIGGELDQEGTGYDPSTKQARVKWTPITITFANVAYDPVEENLLYKFFQQLYDAGYNPPTQDAEANSSILISNSLIKENLSHVHIYTLRPDGSKTSTFKLINPIITGMSVQQVSYESDDLHTFEVTFDYSFVEFTAQWCAT